ncbi:MAG: tetratricopeptide repeat protein [Acidobacteria bacterium]|nr:tetratricopeptide repeat protein [Acidobacteriota bacterium]NIM64319.1 tetratricopeptide repeat protein [Acidobacteriota bacterium]NIQ84962.1 tetratricopeptide repeat protein [Acidobacteriota bacterium]NIT10776.1 tetratricopeptide repeat protein [Acidobacteriota bacterium]
MSALLALAAAITMAPVIGADFDQALDNFKRGKYVEAAADFQEIVDQQPEYDYGWFLLGMSFLKMNKFDDAESSIQKAIDLNGERFEYHHGLANARYKAANYAKTVAALKTAESMADDASSQFALYRLRGLSYIALEKWADAVQDLDKAQKIKKDPVVLDRLSLGYYKLRHYDKALPVLRQAIQAKANDATLLMRMTNSLLNLGAETRDEARKSSYFKEALTTAEKLQGIKGGDSDITNLVGRAAFGAKSFPKAEQAFRKVIAQKPNYCYAMVNLGKVYIAMERWSDADSILGDAAKCAPKMAVVYESRGFALMKQKKLPEAIAQFNKAMEIKPSESTRQMIQTCQNNIEVAEENAAMAALEAKQAAEAAKAQAEYEEAQRKQKEWEEAQRKRDD